MRKHALPEGDVRNLRLSPTIRAGLLDNDCHYFFTLITINQHNSYSVVGFSFTDRPRFKITYV